MQRIFSAWAASEGAMPSLLIEGDSPPRASNGTVMAECTVRVWIINACSWEEAMSVYYLRQGWAPYRPQGEPQPCSKCGALLYPEGSGQCWQCDVVL